MVEETVRQMIWYKLGKRIELDADGNKMLVYISDGFAWRYFDVLYKDKLEDLRYFRVVISTDRFNVYGMTAV